MFMCFKDNHLENQGQKSTCSTENQTRDYFMSKFKLNLNFNWVWHENEFAHPTPPKKTQIYPSGASDVDSLATTTGCPKKRVISKCGSVCSTPHVT